MGNRDGSGQARTPGAGPRVTALPGPSRLVRITEGAFDRVRALALGEEPAPELTEEQVVELELAGLLVDSPDDEDALVLDQHWEQLLRGGLRSPVGAELVCVDGDRGWTTTLRIAGRFVLVIDQEHEVSADETTMRLGRRSNAVLLGLATIEHLGALVRALVPQRPAFTDAMTTAFTTAAIVLATIGTLAATALARHHTPTTGTEAPDEATRSDL